MSRPDLNSRIFVGGLDHSVDEGDLKKAFQIFGDVTNIMVLRDKETGRSRGFAFVSFKDSRSSEDAIRRMHGVEIRGRCVSVRHAEKEKTFDGPPRRPGRGRGGNFSRGRSDVPYGNNGFQRGGGSYTGVSNRGGYSSRDTYDKGRGREDFRGGRDDFLDSRDDYRRRREDYRGASNTLASRSRSPLGAMASSYRDDSPPARGRNYSDRKYSPVRRGNSPKRDAHSRDDIYYGAPKEAREYSPVHTGRLSHGLSPTRDNYSSYGSSMQQLSPTRERNAYISSRTRDSLSPPHSDYRSNSGMRLPRADSPPSSAPRRSDLLDHQEYGAPRSREHDGGSYTQDSYRASSGRSSGSSRDYRSTASNIREHRRDGYSSRGTDVGSSRYDRDEGERYGSTSRLDAGRMSSPSYKRPSASGGSRISSRPMRHVSPGPPSGGSRRF